MKAERSRLLTDVLIELRKESRSSITRIAERLDKPITTIFEAEKRLRKGKIITRYVSMFDFEKANHGVRTIFLLKNSTLLEKNLAGELKLNNLLRIQGEFLIADVVFRNLQQLTEFEEMYSESIISLHHVIRVHKEEAAEIPPIDF